MASKFNTYYKPNVSLHQSILAMLPDPFFRHHKEKRKKAVWQRETKGPFREQDYHKSIVFGDIYPTKIYEKTTVMFGRVKFQLPQNPPL